MSENHKHKAQASVANYLLLRDEVLGTPDCDDAERAESAREIIEIIEKLISV